MCEGKVAAKWTFLSRYTWSSTGIWLKEHSLFCLGFVGYYFVAFNVFLTFFGLGFGRNTASYRSLVCRIRFVHVGDKQKTAWLAVFSHISCKQRCICHGFDRRGKKPRTQKHNDLSVFWVDSLYLQCFLLSCCWDTRKTRQMRVLAHQF